MERTNLAELYDLPTLEWAPVAERLGREITQAPGTGGPGRHTCWLVTLNADGSPHVTGVGAEFVDGSFFFETGETTKKGRNVARDPRVSLSLATDEFDLVVEGTATLVEDRQLVARLAETWAAGGWPCRVDETGTRLTADFSAPSAGSPPWAVYRIDATAATVLAVTGEGGATRFTF